MRVETIVVWLLVDAVAGFLAGLVVKGAGRELVDDIVFGIIEAFAGGYTGREFKSERRQLNRCQSGDWRFRAVAATDRRA